MEHLQSIQKIFQDRLFSVPDYQRGYAWEEHQWQDLWDDIDLLEKGQEHYTGTLVIHAASDEQFSDDNGDEFTQYDIVDGQQRLTTLSILIIKMIRQFEQGVIFEKCCGYRNINEKLTNNKDTAFGIAAGTKMFTGLAICKLIDENKLAFDEKIHHL